jgi:hypothetical protein
MSRIIYFCSALDLAIFVPERAQSLLRVRGNHRGAEETEALIRRSEVWIELRQAVAPFVFGGDGCQHKAILRDEF